MNDEELDAFLEHHGIKGMHWGIRKEVDNVTSNIQQLFKNDSKSSLSAEEEAKLNENKKKHKAKFEKSEDSKKEGWRPTGKQVALTAAGAVLIGGLIYGGLRYNKQLSLLKSVVPLDEYTNLVRPAETPSWIEPLRGSVMSAKDYAGLVENTQHRLWTSEGYITKESFKQKPLSFLKDHEFFRLSQAAETSFGKKTYAVSNREDLNRYRTMLLGKNLISFKAKETVKVPDLYTRLEAMRKAMGLSGHKDLSPASVIAAYNDRSGGGWGDRISEAFFNVLKKDGYHAIVDDMDAGIYGESPLVFFNHDVLTPKKVLSMNAQDPFSKILEITNRR